MQRLMIATDFSPASRHAFEYAEWLSIKLGASLVALHVFPELKAEDSVDRSQLERLQQREGKHARRRLEQFAAVSPESDTSEIAAGRQVECMTRSGPVVDAILETAEEESIDLVILGTRAKHNLLDHLFGSVTTDLIGRTRTPLLIIPEGTTYRNISRIAFATDVELDAQRVLPTLQSFARAIDAIIQSFYVNVLAGEPLPNEKLKTNDITTVRDKSVISGITCFLEKHPSDVLAMYVPQRTFPERLLHRSLTKKMAYLTPIPLLLFKG